MKKTIIIPAFVLLIAGAAILGSATNAQAAQKDRQSMAQQLASKLGINESKVQTAFDTIHEDRQKKMESAFEKRVQDSATSGKITEAQQKLILAKHEEIQSERESERDSVRSMTPEDRRAHMQSERTAFESWADANGIDMSSFFSGPQGSRGGRGHSMMK